MRQLFMQRATRISTNQSDEDWHHVPDSCTWEVFLVFPKRDFSHFSLALFNKNYIFLHFENEIDTGIRLRPYRQVPRPKPVVNLR